MLKFHNLFVVVDLCNSRLLCIAHSTQARKSPTTSESRASHSDRKRLRAEDEGSGACRSSPCNGSGSRNKRQRNGLGDHCDGMVPSCAESSGLAAGSKVASAVSATGIAAVTARATTSLPLSESLHSRVRTMTFLSLFARLCLFRNHSSLFNFF